MTELVKTQTTAVQASEQTQPIVVVSYNQIDATKLSELAEKAKTVEGKELGLPTADSIDYLALDEILQVGQEIRLTYVARTVEARTEETTDMATGEVVRQFKPLPTVILMDNKAKLWKNSSYMFVSHFAPQPSGYQAAVVFQGTKKTQKGNRMHKCTFKPILE